MAVVNLTGKELAGGDIPKIAEARLAATDAGYRITGDRTGAEPLYLYHDKDRIVFSADINSMLSEMRKQKIVPQISPNSISHLLHHALIPAPYTVFENLYFLGIGDRAEIATEGGRIDLTLQNEFPYFCRNSSGGSEPSTAHLLQLLSAAVCRKVDSNSDAFLMLSSGKDSSAIALAIAEAGRTNVRCGTYAEAVDDAECNDAARLCERLGLKHEALRLSDEERFEKDALVGFFENSPFPSCDFTQIPYVICMRQMGLRSGSVIDGTGNDCYMGFVPSPTIRTKLRFRICDRLPSSLLTPFVPIDSPLNYFLRSRAEIYFSGRTFRYSDTRKLYPGAIDSSAYWRRISETNRALDAFDFSSYMLLHFDQKEVMHKGRMAATAQQIGMVFPYCDSELIDYCFNLPEPERFDRKNFVNKIIVRRMLRELCDYDADKIGKRVFRFDGARFFQRHRKFVAEEIGNCALWSKEAQALTGTWLAALDRRPKLSFALLPLFLISGWYNHSRYIQ